MVIKPSRRALITGIASIIAAPAVIRVAQLMPIKPFLAYEPTPVGDVVTQASSTSELLGRQDINLKQESHLKQALNYNWIGITITSGGPPIWTAFNSKYLISFWAQEAPSGS